MGRYESIGQLKSLRSRTFTESSRHKNSSGASRSEEDVHLPRSVSYLGQTSLSVIVGRRIDISRRSTAADWKEHQRKFEDKHFLEGRAVDAAKLILKYTSETEMEAMLGKLFNSGSGVRSKDRDNKIREKIKLLNERSIQKCADEMDIEASYILGETSDLYEQAMARSLDPDYQAHKRLDDTDKRPLDVWLPASFEVGDIEGSFNPHDIVVKIADSAGALKKGREDFLGMMSDVGFDIDLVSDEWRPEITIFQTHPNYPVSGLSGFELPSRTPLLIPLKTPRAYEI